ncbi:MAG: hypothetical protein FNT15_09790 [Sulfurovum sp.]|jgi:hypothetical protein|nr:MAG: hypothetical protein FNT15_09790 [Sulfurovum sp.]
MAKEKKFDNLDLIMDSAYLSETNKSVINRDKKTKTIQILVDWEEKIKLYHGGTVASYITIAIQEKMKHDGIL